MAAVAAAAGVGAAVDAVEREASSAIGSLIAQILGFIRALVMRIMDFVYQFYTWVADNPKAATLMLANLVIWMTG